MVKSIEEIFVFLVKEFGFNSRFHSFLVARSFSSFFFVIRELTDYKFGWLLLWLNLRLICCGLADFFFFKRVKELVLPFI